MNCFFRTASIAAFFCCLANGVCAQSAANSENQSGIAMPHSVKPKLGIPFGTVVSGLVEMGAPTAVPDDREVKISGIEGPVDAIAVVARDVTIYGKSGKQHGIEELVRLEGQRLQFFESGAFYGFPKGFWESRVPVHAPRKFGFYSMFTLQIDDRHAANNDIPVARPQFDKAARD